jgi:acetolactate synthase-1/2/3 large subunit
VTKEEQTVAEYVADFIARKNTPAVFQLSGGMIAFLTDAIETLGKTPLIHNRHEQASGFSAEGATRVSGLTSVAMGTSGPGATNLITPISSCYFDSTPAVFITGQVRTDELKRNPKQRQNGFQELDIASIVKSISKATFKVTSETEVQSTFENAWAIANSGRKGPVLIDLPIDIQQRVIKTTENDVDEYEFVAQSEETAKNKELRELIRKAKNPLVIVGGGVRLSNTIELCRQFLSEYKLPHVSTLLGLDSVDHSEPNYIGYIGSYGNRWANHALQQADLILALGSRLDVRQIGSSLDDFKRGKTIIRVDIDPAELNGRLDAELKICSDLETFFRNCLLDPIESTPEIVFAANKIKNEYPQAMEQYSSEGLNPSEVIERISQIFKDSNGYLVDVGQHQMWAAQSLKIGAAQRFITSGGLGAMGFAIPAAVGASIARKGRWVVIVGDGCMQLSIQELQTISQLNLPLTICIMNNDQHGMVAQFQEENMGGRFVGTRIGFSNPSYRSLAKGFGIPSYHRISSIEEFEACTPLIEIGSTSPQILEFIVSNKMRALPKMKFSND